MPIVSLDRFFLHVPEESEHEDPEALQRAALALGQTADWDAVLQNRVVVLLGERGTGKSTELRAQHRRLQEAGAASFLVPLNTLAADGFVDSLDHADSELFKEWLENGGDEGYFLLDSLDEAKLSGNSLEKALTKLDKAVGGMRRTVHIVVTSRASDWGPVSDRETIQARLVDGEQLAVYQIAPLSDAQIRKLAESEGVPNPDDFGAAIASASAQAFVERPLDVLWLASYWREHEKLGGLRELIEHNIVEKLRESPGRRSSLTGERARAGLEKLAAAATMAAVRSLLIPDDGGETGKHDTALDPRSVLNGWNDEDIHQLLSRAVFDESTYGRVRIHHRMVQEYLAATWLRRLLQAGLSRKRLYNLLFCQSSGKRLVRPHIAATVGWLCLWDDDLRQRILRVAPEILIAEGDPDGLNADVRHRALMVYARRFEDRARLFHTFDRAALGRFADEQLTETINALLARPDGSEELATTLLNLVKEGELVGCADRARELAVAETSSASVRYAAISSVATVGTEGDVRVLQEWANAQDSLDAEVAAALFRCLFPGTIGPEDLASLFKRVTPSPANRFDSLDYFLRYELVDRTLPNMRDSLLNHMLQAVATVNGDGEVKLKPDREWLLRALGTFVGSLLEQGAAEDGDRSEAMGKALDLFRACNEMGMSIRYGVEDVREALSTSKESRRFLFWRTAERRSHSGKSCTRYLDIIDGYRLFELTEDDAGWLSHDAQQRPGVQHRLLAFDTLASIMRRQDAKYVETLRTVASGDAALAKRLERMLNPPASLPRSSFRRYELLHQARERRRERVRENNRRELQKITDRIAAGHLNDVRFLYREADHDMGSWSRVRTDGIEKRYGAEVADAFKTGLKSLWRGLEPVLPHERERRNSTPEPVIFGLAGATLEFDEGLDIRTCDDDALRKLVRYAACELNGFAPWLEVVADQNPSIVAATLSDALAADYGFADDGTRINDALAKLPRAAEAVRRACVFQVVELLVASDPPQIGALLSSLELTLSLDPTVSGALDGLFDPRCRAHVPSPERFAVWWVAWASREAEQAIDLLDEIACDLSDEAFDQLVQEICHRIYEWSESFSVVSLKKLHEVSTLQRLIPIVLSSVRSRDDLWHEDAFSPGKRDHAQTIRGRLVSRLMSIEGEESVAALRALADDPRASEYRDWFLSRADQRIASSEPCAPLTVADAVAWSRQIPQPVKNDEQLFEVALDRLDDVRMFVEQHDHSYRAVYTAAGANVQEEHAQILLADELRRRSVQQYTVSREEEADRKKKPDIRVFNQKCGGPVSIEVKVAEKWSFNELLEALRDQLVGKYLREVYSTQGILMLCAMGPSKKWKNTDGTLLTFPQLVERLDQLAAELCTAKPDVDSLRVVGIDFH